MKKKLVMNFSILLSLILTLVFWPPIMMSSSISLFQETTATTPGQTQEQKTPLEVFIDSLDQALSKLDNKKLAVLNFESLEGPGLEREAVVASEKLVQALVNSGRFEIVDRAFLNIKSAGELNMEVASRWTSTLGLGAIIAGNVAIGAGNEVEVNLKVINLKTLSIILTGQLKMRPAAATGSQAVEQPKQSDYNQGQASTAVPSPYDQLKQKIAGIVSSRMEAQSKEKLIMETLGEAFKATPKTKYSYAYFPCGMAPAVCEQFGLQDGFYKIFFDDELILTVDRQGRILECYYFGKNHPQRVDLRPEEILEKRTSK